MKIIIISGTPGCGKTSVSKQIGKLVDIKIISLNKLALSNNFSFEYDIERKTIIIDFKILLPYILEKIEDLRKSKNKPLFLIIESHFSDIIPEEYIDFAFILRCHPDELLKRLKKREYNLKKIKENIQTEILGNCAYFFLQKKRIFPLFEIDTTNLNIPSIADIILSIVNGTKEMEKFTIGKIDWLGNLFQENRLKEFFD